MIVTAQLVSDRSPDLPSADVPGRRPTSPPPPRVAEAHREPRRPDGEHISRSHHDRRRPPTTTVATRARSARPPSTAADAPAITRTPRSTTLGDRRRPARPPSGPGRRPRRRSPPPSAGGSWPPRWPSGSWLLAGRAGASGRRPHRGAAAAAGLRAGQPGVPVRALPLLRERRPGAARLLTDGGDRAGRDRPPTARTPTNPGRQVPSCAISLPSRPRAVAARVAPSAPGRRPGPAGAAHRRPSAASASPCSPSPRRRSGALCRAADATSGSRPTAGDRPSAG